MSTIIYPSPIFGPVHSRRLGLSLGINLLPEDGKVCRFDCIYCECGFNQDHIPKHPLPSREQVCHELEKTLLEMQAKGLKPDVLTFAGNGEPTTHPMFHLIVDDVITLRDRYCPQAKISVLSNATHLNRPEVFDALLKVDNNIQKLDTVDPDYIRLVDRPKGLYDVRQVIEQLRAFRGHVIIQTMFLKGTFGGQDADNTTDRYVLPWIETVVKIRPRQVMIYTIDRETPAPGLQKATHAELDRIADLVKEKGINVNVSY